MDKPAPTDHPVHDLIRDRWSPRAFSERPVSSQVQRSLLEAARWAPSSFNEQPWHFIVATRDEPVEFARMLNCLVNMNRAWAQHAPVLLLAVARTDFRRNDKPNRHALYDTGQAVASLTLQATAFGLAVHQMGGFSIEQARSTYDIPEDCEPVAAIAIGYPGDPQSLPDELRTLELSGRDRRPLGGFVFAGRWEATSPLVDSASP